MRLINGIVKAFYGRAATIIENKNKHRSFNEMIQWRRNREKIERLQRNKKLMVMLKRDINPRFQLADISAYSLPVASDEDASKGWRDLGLREVLVKGLVSGLKLKSPLPAQVAAIPAILKNRDLTSSLFSAPTGCGKTLIYLLPLFEGLKRDEEVNGRCQSGPRALILVPTHELVRQVHRSAKALSYYSKLRVETIDSVHKFKDSTPVDILISTPRAVMTKDSITRALSRSLKTVIVDEADTLFSAGFADEVKAIILAAKSIPEKVTIMATSATITRQLHKAILALRPDLKILTAQGLHSPPPILKQRFHLINQPGNAKMQLALQIVAKEPTSRILVFCNKLSKAESLHKFLCDSILEMGEQPASDNQSFAYVAASNTLPSIFHGNLPPVQRAGLIEKFNSGEIRVLVCTDLAARGLDMPLVNHVINFDFPRSLQDYLHRAGRTARAGRGGSVTSFVTAKDRALYEYIQLAAKQKRILSEPLKT